MIGLVGAHRTGKTTLALELSEREGFSFVKTDSSGVFTRLGFDPKKDYDFKTRLMLQEAILEDAYTKWRAHAGEIFITDRTPLDMLGYTYADVSREPLSPEVEVQLARYAERAFEITNRVFGLVVLVQPGIPLIEAPGKAPASPAFIAHLTNLMRGLMVDERVLIQKYSIPVNKTDLSDRVLCVKAAFEQGRERALGQHLPIGAEVTPAIFH